MTICIGQERALCAATPKTVFELWRKYCVDHAIGSVNTKARTVTHIHSYPQCHSMPQLAKHLCEWDLARMEVGQDLLDGHVCSMLIRILPPEMKTDVKKDTSLKTFQSVWGFVDLGLAGLHGEHVADPKHANKDKRVSLSARMKAPYGISMVQPEGDPTREPPSREEAMTKQLADLRAQVTALQNKRSSTPPPRGQDRTRDGSRSPRGRSPLVRAVSELTCTEGKRFECCEIWHPTSECPTYLAVATKMPDGKLKAPPKPQDVVPEDER